MRFKVGDKIKFLNESGGGFVSKIISPSMVEVDIQDGFSIPYSTSELLLVEDQGTASRFFDEDFGEKPDSVEEVEEAASFSPEVSTELFKRQSMDLKKGLYLAFVPQDQKWLMTGLIDVYILNHSDYRILFSLFLNQENKNINKEFDLIEKNNKFLIDSIDRDDLNQWTQGHLQALFVPLEAQKIIAPLNKKYQIKGAKFYQESHYKHIDLLEANALTVEMIAMDYQEMISKADPIAEKDKVIAEEPKASIKKQKGLIESHTTAPLEAEVDLHISALNDDYGHLKPFEILDEQLSYFNKAVENAMLHQYTKVIFIHGIGNGTLKKKLKDELRDYQEISVRDASFQHYGYGAIEVSFSYK